MAYIITEPCVGVKDAACVEVCPVDCIYAKDDDDMYYIHPDECIDCGACVPECPVNAIYEETEVPAEWQHFIHQDDRHGPDLSACAAGLLTRGSGRQSALKAVLRSRPLT